uniref:Uncharacterized protein n=1 Tax=Anopheles farauti TaxID=69004 RepID=A0A182Q5M4_9DIPT
MYRTYHRVLGKSRNVTPKPANIIIGMALSNEHDQQTDGEKHAETEPLHRLAAHQVDDDGEDQAAEDGQRQIDDRHGEVVTLERVPSVKVFLQYDAHLGRDCGEKRGRVAIEYLRFVRVHPADGLPPRCQRVALQLTRQHGQHHGGHHVVHEDREEQIKAEHGRDDDVDADPQMGECGVPLRLDNATLDQHLQLVHLGRARQVLVLLDDLLERVLLAQLLELEQLPPVGEPIRAFAVPHLHHHALDAVLAVLTTGQFNH